MSAYWREINVQHWHLLTATYLRDLAERNEAILSRYLKRLSRRSFKDVRFAPERGRRSRKKRTLLDTSGMTLTVLGDGASVAVRTPRRDLAFGSGRRRNRLAADQRRVQPATARRAGMAGNALSAEIRIWRSTCSSRPRRSGPSLKARFEPLEADEARTEVP